MFPTAASTTTRKAFAVRVRVTRPSVTREISGTGRSTQRLARPRTRQPANQIRERDWQPSTGTLAPLIQLARGDARNATTAPTSSGRPKRPNGSSAARTRPSLRIVLDAPIPRPPQIRIDPGATLLTRMLSLRQLLGHRLREADFGGLHRVVGHPAAGFAAPDRRNHHDRRRRRASHVRDRHARRSDGRKQRLVEAPPATRRPWCPTMPAASGEPDVVDEDVEAAEGLDGSHHDVGDAFVGRHVSLDGQHRAESRRQRSAALRSPPASPASPRAQMVTLQPSCSRAMAVAKPETASGAGDDGGFVVKVEIHAPTDRRGRSGRSRRPVELPESTWNVLASRTLLLDGQELRGSTNARTACSMGLREA